MAPVLLPPQLDWYDFGLVKADEQASEAAPWVIWIRASTPDIDFEGERVAQRVMRTGAPYFIKNGRITWEHLDHERRYDPSIIIGEPMDVQFPDNGDTLVQARLYPLVPRAQSVWQILRSGGRLKASIGGSCAKKQGRDGVMEIAQIYWSHLALTPYPVNDHTEVSLQPFSAFIAKALGTTSAAPLVMQDLEGAMHQQTPAFLGRWQALTEVIQQLDPTRSEEDAKRAALLLMARRGETRQAFTSQHWNPLS